METGNTLVCDEHAMYYRGHFLTKKVKILK